MVCHPSTPCAAVSGIEVMLTWAGNERLWIDYVLSGKLDDLRLPLPAAQARHDGLWQTTCFELFVQGAGSSYREYNFSPSSAWAAYGFESYRAGMRDLDTDTPKISARREADRFVLSVELAIGPDAQAIGLSAVIEEADGTKSYWALAHPPGKPDFHHADCFALRLAAGEGI